MEHLQDQYLDGLDSQQEADEQALYDFFCGDLDLFKAVQNEF